jgi:hypothetical protein
MCIPKTGQGKALKSESIAFYVSTRKEEKAYIVKESRNHRSCTAVVDDQIPDPRHEQGLHAWSQHRCNTDEGVVQPGGHNYPFHLLIRAVKSHPASKGRPAPRGHARGARSSVVSDTKPEFYRFGDRQRDPALPTEGRSTPIIARRADQWVLHADHRGIIHLITCRRRKHLPLMKKGMHVRILQRDPCVFDLQSQTP